MFGKVGSFFGEAKQELQKVNWPTRQELMDSTVLVLVVTAFLALFIFGVDIVLSFIIRWVIR